MADFDIAIKIILKHEGGFVDDPDDNGGATNYGISSRFLSSYINDPKKLSEIDFNKNNYIDAEDIKNLDVETAKKIYKICWWDKYKYGSILDQSIATKIFDIAVNIGPYQAHKICQREINIISSGYKLQEDGIFGPRTLNAINMVCPTKFLEKFKEECGNFYKNICRKNETLNKYLKGWMNRVAD